MSYYAIGLALDMSKSTVHRLLNPSARARSKATGAAYRVTHKEERNSCNSTYRATHKDELTAYRVAHRADAIERGVVYRATHTVEEKARHAVYRAAHRVEEKEHRVAYRATHKAERSDQQARRRALKAGAVIGATVSQLAEIAEIYRLAKESPKVRCYLCGKLIPIGHRHVDHIIPLAKGGAHRPSNLAVACDHCNLHKSAKLPNEVGVLI